VPPTVTDALVVHHEPARSYTVRPGDTLSSIAQRLYGNPANWPWLYDANNSVIRNPALIHPARCSAFRASRPPAPRPTLRPGRPR
jgi:nucleoid-associated protein YgaU